MGFLSNLFGTKASAPRLPRKNVVIDGVPYCGYVTIGPGSISVTSVTPGVCPIDEPPIGQPPAGRLLRANIDYPTDGASGIRRNVDMMQFSAVLGHATFNDAERAWPGADGASIVILTLPANGYIAMAFTATDERQFNILRMASYGNDVSHAAIASVSLNPGDFNPATAVHVSPPRGPGEAFFKTVVAPRTNGAQVQRGRTYYLNLRFANATTPHALALTQSAGLQA